MNLLFLLIFAVAEMKELYRSRYIMELVTKPYLGWFRQCFIFSVLRLAKFSAIALYQAKFSFILLSFLSVAKIRVPGDTAVFLCIYFLLCRFYFFTESKFTETDAIISGIGQPVK